jgi:hypothetical protein
VKTFKSGYTALRLRGIQEQPKPVKPAPVPPIVAPVTPAIPSLPTTPSTEPTAPVASETVVAQSIVLILPLQ